MVNVLQVHWPKINNLLIHEEINHKLQIQLILTSSLPHQKKKNVHNLKAFRKAPPLQQNKAKLRLSMHVYRNMVVKTK